MKSLLYLQICNVAPWPKPISWLSELKKEVATLRTLELDNFSNSQLISLAKRYVQEADVLAIVLEVQSAEARLGPLLPLVQHATKSGILVQLYLTGTLGKLQATQLNALAIPTEDFSKNAVSGFLVSV